MPEHIVKAYTGELEALVHDVSALGGLAEASVHDCLTAVARRDVNLAQAVIERDPKIDAGQREIEQKAIRIFALRHPVADDLRSVIAAWRMSGELERIGDLAKNIAKRALVLNESEPLQVTRSVERMGRMVAAHLKQVLDAFAVRDVQAALSVWIQDESVDENYNSLFRELLTYMMEDPRTIGACAHLLFVAKNIERIGDHCTNIAENVHYLVSGEELIGERPKVVDV